MPGPILVPGGAGFVGSHLIDLLGSEGAGGADLVAWHRPGGTAPVSASHVRWQGIELLDRAQVHRALVELRPAAIYHCAGAAHVGRSWEKATSTLASNVRG